MELRRDFPDVKIIAMTGGVASMIGSATLFQAGKLGTQRTIEKPVTKAELLDAVSAVLG
jgi:hypothetical protein